MATVYITQKIDHSYDDLTHNSNADALIFLPESAGVNSAGQVISIFNDSSNPSDKQRYAVIVTGTKKTGELTVTGNWDRHTSFSYTAAQELADGSVADGNDLPVLLWQTDSYGNDVYYQVDANGNIQLYCSYSGTIVYFRESGFTDENGIYNLLNGTYTIPPMSVWSDEHGCWMIPDAAKADGTEYTDDDLINIKLNDDTEAMLELRQAVTDGRFVQNDDGSFRGERVTWTEGVDYGYSGVIAYKYGEDWRDENGHPVYDDVNGKRLPVLKDGGAYYRADSTGQTIYYQSGNVKQSYIAVGDSDNFRLIENPDKIIMAKADENGEPIAYKMDTVNNKFNSYLADSSGNVIYYETDADGNFVKYEANGQVINLYATDENGNFRYVETETENDVTYYLVKQQVWNYETQRYEYSETEEPLRYTYVPYTYTYDYSLGRGIYSVNWDRLFLVNEGDDNASLVEVSSSYTEYDTAKAKVAESGGVANQVWIDADGNIIDSKVAVQDGASYGALELFKTDSNGNVVYFQVYAEGEKKGQYVIIDKKYQLALKEADGGKLYDPDYVGSHGGVAVTASAMPEELDESGNLIGCSVNLEEGTATIGGIASGYYSYTYDNVTGEYILVHSYYRYDERLGLTINAGNIGKMETEDLTGRGYEEAFVTDEYGRVVYFKADGSGVKAYNTDSSGQVIGYYVGTTDIAKDSFGNYLTPDNPGQGHSADEFWYIYDEKNGIPAYDGTNGGGAPIAQYQVSAGQVMSFKGDIVRYYVTDEAGNFIYYRTNDAGEVEFYKTDSNGALVTYRSNADGFIKYNADVNGDLLRYEVETVTVDGVEQQQLVQYCADENGNLLYFDYDHATGQYLRYNSDDSGNLYKYNSDIHGNLLKYYADENGNLLYFPVDENGDFVEGGEGVAGGEGSLKELTRYAVDANGNFITVDGNKQVWTADSGTEWRYDENGQVQELARYAVDADGNFIVVDGNKQVWTADSGLAWRYDEDGQVQELTRYAVDADGNFITVDGSKQVWTADSGLAWRYDESDIANSFYQTTTDSADGMVLRSETDDAVINGMIDAQGYGETNKAVTKYRADADGNIIWYEAEMVVNSSGIEEQRFVDYCARQDGSLVYFEYDEATEQYILYSADANGNLADDAKELTRYEVDANGDFIIKKGQKVEWKEGSENSWKYDLSSGNYFYKEVEYGGSGQILLYNTGDATIDELIADKYTAGYNPIQYGGFAPENGKGFVVSAEQDGAYDLSGAVIENNDPADANTTMMTTTRYIADADGNILYFNAANESSTDPNFGERREWTQSSDGNWAYDLTDGSFMVDANGTPIKVDEGGERLEAPRDRYGNYLSGKADEGESGRLIYYATDSSGKIVYYNTDENGDVIYYQQFNGYIRYDRNGNPLEAKYVADENGNILYFNADGASSTDSTFGEARFWTEDDGFYAYDSKNGMALARKVVADENGNVLRFAVDENGNFLRNEDGEYITVNVGGATRIWESSRDGKYWAYDTVNGKPVEAPTDEYGNYISGKPLELFVTDERGELVYYKYENGDFVYTNRRDELGNRIPEIAYIVDNTPQALIKYFAVDEDDNYQYDQFGNLIELFVCDENTGEKLYFGWDRDAHDYIKFDDRNDINLDELSQEYNVTFLGIYEHNGEFYLLCNALAGVHMYDSKHGRFAYDSTQGQLRYDVINGLEIYDDLNGQPLRDVSVDANGNIVYNQDGNQVQEYIESSQYFDKAEDGDLTTETHGIGSLVDKSSWNGPDYTYMDATYNINHAQYNGSATSGAVLFSGTHNYLVLSAQSGAGNADIYHTAVVPDKGYDMDTTIYKKTDDAIKIKSTAYGIYSYFNNAGGELTYGASGSVPAAPYALTETVAIHAENTLTVSSDLAGSIEAYTASLHTGYWKKDSPGYDNDADNTTNRAYAVKAKDLLLDKNFRAVINAANNADTFEDAMSYVDPLEDSGYRVKELLYNNGYTATEGGPLPEIPGNKITKTIGLNTYEIVGNGFKGTTLVAFANAGVKGNDISTYGIYTSGGLSMNENSIWSGNISVETSDTLLLNDKSHWAVAPSESDSSSIANNTIAAYGVYTGGSFTIDTMGTLKKDDLYGDDYGDDWDQGDQSASFTINLNNNEIDGSNAIVKANNLSDDGNALRAVAIHADTINIDTVTDQVRFNVNFNNNRVSTMSKSSSSSIELYAAALEADTINIGRFDGNINIRSRGLSISNFSLGTSVALAGFDASTINISLLLAGNITIRNDISENYSSGFYVYGFTAGKMYTAGVIDTNISLKTYYTAEFEGENYSYDELNGIGIEADTLETAGFTGKIEATYGISVEQAKSSVANDAVDIAGSITVDGTAFLSVTTINLRVSGEIYSTGYAINAEYRVRSYGNNTGTIHVTSTEQAYADRVEFAAGARVVGDVELGLGGESGDANKVVINSQAMFQGHLYATGGTLNLRFDLEDEAQDGAVVTIAATEDGTHEEDQTLSATNTFTINLNFAQEDETYTLIKYGFDAKNYWANPERPRKIAFNYQGYQSDNVVLRTNADNTAATGNVTIYDYDNVAIATATVSYNFRDYTVTVTVDDLADITEDILDRDANAEGSQLVYSDLWSADGNLIDISNLHRYLTTKLDAEKVLNIGGKELDRISSYLVTYTYTKDGSATRLTGQSWLHVDSKGNIKTDIALASGVVVDPESIIITVNSEAATGEDPMTDCTTVWNRTSTINFNDNDEIEDLLLTFDNDYYSGAGNEIVVNDHNTQDPITLRSFENYVVTYIFFDENGNMLDKNGNVVTGDLNDYSDYLKYGVTIETRTLENIEISHRDIPANATSVHYAVAVKGASDIALEIDETAFEGNGIIVNRNEAEAITSIDWTFADQLWKATINSENQLSFNGLTINSIEAYKLAFTYTLNGETGVAYTEFLSGTSFELFGADGSYNLYTADGNQLGADAEITGYDLSIHGVSKEMISGVIDNNEAHNRFLENYDAENDALTISWHALDNYSDDNIAEAKFFELEYVLYDANGNPLSYIDANGDGHYNNGERATSIAVTLDATQREYTIGGVKDGVRVEWRARLINDASATATTNWTAWKPYDTPSEHISEFSIVNNTAVRDASPTLSEKEGMVTAVSEIAWENTFTSEQTIREYEIEYVALSSNIKYSTVKAKGFDSLSEYISCNADVNGNEDGLFADIRNEDGYDAQDAVIFSKTVTSTDAILAELQDQSYIYWRVRAVDANGNKSEWVDGKTFRVWGGERDENRPVFRDKTTALIGYSIPDVTVVNDKLTAPEDKTYTASIAWNAATDSQSQVRLYRIECLVDGKYELFGQVNAELDINKGLVALRIPPVPNADDPNAANYQYGWMDDSAKYQVVITTDNGGTVTVDAFLRMVDGVLTLQWSSDAENIFQHTPDANGDKVWTLDANGQKILNTTNFTIQKFVDGAWQNVVVDTNDLSAQFFDYSYTIEGLTGPSYNYRIVAVDYFGNATLEENKDWEIKGKIEVDNTLPFFDSEETVIFGLPRYSMPSENDYSSNITYSATVAWNSAVDPESESNSEYGTYVKSYVIKVTDVKTKETVSITIDPATLHGGWIASYQSSELNSAYKYQVRYTVGEDENATTVTLDAFVKDSNGIKSLVWCSDAVAVCSGSVEIIIVGAVSNSTFATLSNGAYSVKEFDNVYSISGLTGGEYTYQIEAVDYTGQSSIQVAGKEPIIADRGAPIFAGYVNEVLWNNSYFEDVVSENNANIYDKEKRFVPTFRWSKALDVEGDQGVRYYTINIYSGSKLVYTDNIAPDSELYLSEDGITFEYTIDPRNGNANFQNGYEYFKATNYSYEIIAVDYFGKESTLTGTWGSSDMEGPYGTFSNPQSDISYRADGSAQVTLSWGTTMKDHVSKVYYRVTIADNSDFEGDNVYVFWTTSSSLDFSNSTVGRPASIFENMETVHWKVEAFDESYNRADDLSAKREFTFTDGSGDPITSTGPGAPANISVTTTKMDDDKVVFTDEIALSWSDEAAGLGTYRYVITLKNVVTGEVIASADTLDLSDYLATDMLASGIKISGNTFQVTDIRKLFGLSGINDGQYEIAITAYDAQGRSASSSSDVFSVDTSRPGMVSMINNRNEQGIRTIAVSAGSDETELLFHWDPVTDSTSGIRGYVLRYRPAGSNLWYEKFVEGTSCSFNVTNDSTSWEYYVTAIDGTGDPDDKSTPSNQLSNGNDLPAGETVHAGGTYYGNVGQSTPIYTINTVQDKFGGINAAYIVSDRLKESGNGDAYDGSGTLADQVGRSDRADAFTVKVGNASSFNINLRKCEYVYGVAAEGSTSDLILTVYDGNTQIGQIYINSSQVGQSIYTNAALESGKTYTFVISSANSDAVVNYELQWSQTVTGNIDTWFDTTATVTSVIDGGVNPGNFAGYVRNSAVLSWDKIFTGTDRSIVGYEYSYTFTNEENGETVNVTGTATAKSANIDFEHAKGNVEWQVRALDSEGNYSAWIAGQDFRVLGEASDSDDDAPVFAANSTVARVTNVTTNNQVDQKSTIEGYIYWNAADDGHNGSGVKAYEIEISTDGGVTYTKWKTVDAKVRNGAEGYEYSISISDIRDKQFTYRIRAIDYKDNVSRYTYGNQIITDNTAPMFSNANVQVECNEIENTNTFRPVITWEPATDQAVNSSLGQSYGVKYYSVYFRVKGSDTWVLQTNILAGDDLSYTMPEDTSLENDKVYEYKIVAYDHFGNASENITGTFRGPDKGQPTGSITANKVAVNTSYGKERMRVTFTNGDIEYVDLPAEGPFSWTGSRTSYSYSGSSSSETLSTVEIKRDENGFSITKTSGCSVEMVSAELVEASVELSWKSNVKDPEGSEIIYKVTVSDASNFKSNSTYEFWTTDTSLVFGGNTVGRPLALLTNMNEVYWMVEAYDASGNVSEYAAEGQKFDSSSLLSYRGLNIDKANDFKLTYQNITAPKVTVTPTLVNGMMSGDAKVTLKNDADAVTGYYVYNITMKDQYGRVVASKSTLANDTDQRSDDIAGVTVSEDGLTVTIASLKKFFGLAAIEDGSYTLEIAASNGNGYGATTVYCQSQKLELDTTAPAQVEIIRAYSQPKNLGNRSQTVFGIEWSKSSDNRGIAYYEVNYRVYNSAASGKWTTVNVGLATSYELDLNYSGSNSYEFQVVAVDVNGNRSVVANDESVVIAPAFDKYNGSLNQIGGITKLNWSDANTLAASNVVGTAFNLDDLFKFTTGGDACSLNLICDSLEKHNGYNAGLNVMIYKVNGKDFWGNDILTLVSNNIVWDVSRIFSNKMFDANSTYVVKVTNTNPYNSVYEYSLHFERKDYVCDNNDDSIDKVFAQINSGNGADYTLTTSKSDRVGFGDTIDYMYFDPVASGKYTFSLSGVASTAIMYVYEYNNTWNYASAIAAVSASAWSVDGVTTHELILDANKQYFVAVVDGLGGYTVGTEYTVSVNTVETYPAATTADDTVETTSSITVANGVSGWVGYGDLNDYHKINVNDTHGAVINISVSHQPTEGPLVAYVWQDNGYGQLALVGYQYLVTGVNSVSTGALYLAGDSSRSCYLQITAPSGAYGYNSSYQITTSGYDITDALVNDSNNERTQNIDAVAVNSATDSTGWVGSGDQTDFWKLENANGGIYNITINRPVEYADFGNIVTVTVWRENGYGGYTWYRGITLYQGDNSESTGDFYLEAAGDKNYYIEVSAPYAAYGWNSHYSLDVNSRDVETNDNANNDKEGALTVNVNNATPVSGWVGVTDARDCYKVEGIVSGESYTVNLTGINGSEIYASLGYYNTWGQFVALYTKLGAYKADSMSLSMTIPSYYADLAAQNGGFYLQVNANGNSGYELQINDNRTLAGASAADDLGGALAALNADTAVAGWVGLGYQKDIRTVGTADAGLYDLCISGVTNPVQVIVYKEYNGYKYAVKSMVVSAGDGVIENLLLPGNNGEYSIEVNALYAAYGMNTDYSIELERVAAGENMAISNINTLIGDNIGIDLANGTAHFYRQVSEAGGAYNFNFSGTITGTAVMNVYEMLANGTQRFVRQLVLNNYIAEAESGSLFLDDSANVFSTGIYKFEVVSYGGAGTVNIECSGYDVTDYIANKDVAFEFGDRDWVGKGDAEDVKTGVTVANDGIYSFNFSGINGNNLYFQVIDESTGLAVASFYPAYGCTDTTYSCALKANASYKLVVRSLDGGYNCFSEYTMSAPVLRGTDSDNNTAGNMCSILDEAANVPVEGWVGTGDTIDYIKLELDGNTVAGKYDIGFAGLQNGVYATLYEQTAYGLAFVANKYVTAADNSLSGLNLVDGKEYYLSISALAGNGYYDSEYSVSVTRTRDYTGLTDSSINVVGADWNNGVYETANWVGFCNTSDVYNLGELQGAINITLTLGNASDAYADETGNLYVTLWRCNSYGTRIEALGTYAAYTWNSSVASGDICINTGDTYSYQIEVNGYGVNSDYVLNVENWDCDSFTTADNNLRDAREITVNAENATASAVWNSKWQGDMVDYYRFSVSGNGGSYTIHLDNANSNVRVWLYNSYGAAMQVGYVAQATGEVNLSANLSAGDYYVAVENYTYSTASHYELSVDKNPVNNSDDSWQKVAANVYATLYRASDENLTPTCIEDWVGFGDSVDVFKVMTDENGQLVFGGKENTDTDDALRNREITLSLVDANGNWVSLNFNSENGEYTTATTLMADSEYYLAINSTQYYVKNNTYSITVNKKH